MAKLVECIPNFSCSKEKDEATYNALVEAANSVPGCTLFDAQTDGNHNRCVFTLIGDIIWDELKVPSFLYEDSATRPERRNLATCRKGEFEGMPEKLLQEEWAPDYGERKIHPTAGITAIGARMPLVAFNINLATSDVEVAKKIAKVIRGSSGGFRSCKAMGFMMEDRGIAQVSMNMVNYEDTPLYVVYEQVRALAERYGTYIVDSEIVGLTPAKAMIDCAEFYLKARDFNCHNQIMEYHLLDMK